MKGNQQESYGAAARRSMPPLNLNCLNGSPRRPCEPAAWYRRSTVLTAFLLALLVLAPQAPSGRQDAGATAREASGPAIREQELFSMVRNRSMFTDDQLVEMIASRGIAFRLTDATRGALRKQGVSPTVMQALDRAAEALKHSLAPSGSNGAAQPAAETGPPPPPALAPVEQTRLIEQAREQALEYTERLPNFICVQIIRRSVDFTGARNWQPMDVIQVRLAYNEHKENYKVISVNEQITDRSYDSLGGATSTGEFGSLLAILFEPRTQTKFDYLGPDRLRGRQVQVYEYNVAQERSQWHLN